VNKEERKMEISVLEKFEKGMRSESFMKPLRKVIEEDSKDGMDIITATTSLITWLTVEANTLQQRKVIKPYVEKIWIKLNDMIRNNKFNVIFLKEFLKKYR